MDKVLKDKMSVDIYYAIDDNGNKVIDTDLMTEEFNTKLDKLKIIAGENNVEKGNYNKSKQHNERIG